MDIESVDGGELPSFGSVDSLDWIRGRLRGIQDVQARQPVDELAPASPRAPVRAEAARRLVGPRTLFGTLARRERRRRRLLAHHAPAMIGDFFGGSGFVTVLVPGPLVTDTVPNGFLNGFGFDTSNAFQGVDAATGQVNPFVFAGEPTGGQLPLLIAIGSDTTGDGLLDTFPNLTQQGGPPVSSMLDPAFLDSQQGFVAMRTGGALPFLSETGQPIPVFAVRQQVLVDVPSPGSGGVVGRMKIGENTSPLPRDRIFLNYSYFDNVPLTRGGVNVNRFSPGFEKTFFEGMASVDVRFPFASTLNTGIMAGGISDTSHVEFGNITVALKALFEATETWAVSGGMAIAFPTGDDVNVGLTDGTDLIRIENESVHLMPFLGMLVTPNERFFAQAFLQFDFDANGNPVLINDFVNGLQPAGDANDASFLYADLSLGYLLFHRPYDDGFLRSFTPMLEMHYNRSLQKTDVIRSGFFQVGRVADNIELLNAVVGGRFEFQNDKSLTLAYATPLGGGADQQFDGELRVIFNWLFGASKHE